MVIPNLKNNMKTLNQISVIIFSISVIILTSCGTELKQEPTTAENLNSDAPINEPSFQEETLCFVSKNAEGGQFPIQLTIKGDSITGTSDETIEWTGEKTTFSGIRKGDTLFLNSVFRDGAGGDFVTQETSYLLQSEKLLGKKDPSKSQFSLTFEKVNCK